MFRAEGSIPVIGDRSAPLPYHYSVADGALFIILIKTTIIHFSFSNAGPCTFPQFNFSSFYLYTKDLLGSNVNVARDRIQFVA